MSAAQPALNFETALAELESIVQTLESGKIPLDESVAAYERGMELRKICEDHLKNAELKIKKVSASADGTLTETELDPDTLQER